MKKSHSELLRRLFLLKTIFIGMAAIHCAQEKTCSESLPASSPMVQTLEKDYVEQLLSTSMTGAELSPNSVNPGIEDGGGGAGSLNSIGTDVIFISIDTQRVDRLGIYGYLPNTSPNIDSFAQEAVVFRDHHVQAPLTLPSHVSMMTGLNPPNHGVRSNGHFQLTGSAVTLAEMLKSNGYATAAIISADVLNPVFGMNQGFDVYSGNFIGVYDDTGQTDAVSATERAVDWLEKRASDEPVFLFVHYYDPHPPFRAPSRFSFGHPYDAEVAFVDEQIGELFGVLKKSGRYQDALIVITADHGESLGEHGVLGHTLVLFEETLHVPLIIRFPAAENAGRQVETLTRSIDLMPTIMGRLGIPLITKIDGFDLAKSINGQQDLGSIGSYADTLYMGFPYLHQRSLIRNGWKTISLYNLPPNFDTQEQYRSGALLAMLRSEIPKHLVANCVKIMMNIPDGRVLFNLEKDGDERNNLNEVKPLIADDMERTLSPGITYHPDDNLTTRLKNLGYVQ